MAKDANMYVDRAGDTSQRCGNAPAFPLPDDFTESENPPIPLSFKDLAARLEAKGFSGDRDVAEFLLGRISYKTLLQYCLLVETDAEAERCVKNAHILLDFDRALQALFMKWIGAFELQFRAQYSNAMASEHGAFSHRVKGNFVDENHFHDFLSNYSRELEYKMSARADIRSTCEAFGDLPIWQAVEILPFGTLSKMYRNTRSKAVRFAVSDSFGIEYATLSSWMRTVSEVRNRCAHFSSLLCKPIVCKPRKLESVDADNGSAFFFAVMLKVLSECDRPYEDLRGLYDIWFIDDLMSIADKYDPSVLRIAGFPENYRDMLLKVR